MRIAALLLALLVAIVAAREAIPAPFAENQMKVVEENGQKIGVTFDEETGDELVEPSVHERAAVAARKAAHLSGRNPVGRPQRPPSFELATPTLLFAVGAEVADPDNRHFHAPFPECEKDSTQWDWGTDVTEIGCFSDGGDPWDVRGFVEFNVINYVESPMHQGTAFLTCTVNGDGGLFDQPGPAMTSPFEIDLATYFRKYLPNKEYNTSPPGAPKPAKRVYESQDTEQFIGTINAAGLSDGDVVSIDITDFYDASQTDPFMLQGFKMVARNADNAQCEAISLHECHITSLIFGGAGRDPHFVGFRGQRYEVMGEAGEVYNILSDEHVQVNALFGKSCNDEATTIEAMGIKYKEFTISMNAEGLALVGTNRVDPRKVYELGSEEDYVVVVPNAKRPTMQVHVGGYIITMEQGKSRRADCEDTARLDFTIAMTAADAKPDGLLGVSATKAARARHHMQEQNVQRMLEGDISAFRVSHRDLFGDEFERNKYTGATRTRNPNAVFSVRMATNTDVDVEKLMQMKFSHVAHPSKTFARDAERARRQFGLD